MPNFGILRWFPEKLFFLVMEYNIFSNDPTQQTVHHYSLLCVFGMLYTLSCTKPLDCADDGVKNFSESVCPD